MASESLLTKTVLVRDVVDSLDGSRTRRKERQDTLGMDSLRPLRLCVMLFQVQQVIDHYTNCYIQIAKPCASDR